MARNMVATSHTLATEAGLSMLRQGGNAADAALAAAIALTVVEPTSNGIGGDVFAQIWDGRELNGLNSSGHAPLYWTPKLFEGRKTMPVHGWHAVTIPGAVAAWAEVAERFCKLPLTTLAAPAIRHAEEGFAVTPITATAWARAAAGPLKEQPDFVASFMPGGRAPAAGEVFRFPAQARTLEEIARTRGESFYRGAIAERLIAAAKASGVTWTQGDLLGLAPRWVTPLATRFAGWDLHEIPPNGQGIAALIALAVLRHTDLAAHPPDSAQAVHLQIEAVKLAYADARRYVADPGTMTLHPDALLDDGYAKERAQLIDPARARTAEAGAPKQGGTVCLSAADENGMMVSFIQSNWMGFGSGVVVDGISLHNRGNAFSLDPAHPNAVAPRKKPFHTIIPGFWTKDGAPVGPFGVMGGSFQAQGHVQMTVRAALWGQDLQRAFDAPRWRFDEGLEVRFEKGFDPKVVEALAAKGHAVGFEDYPGFGGAQGILRRPDGTYEGASDKRKDGCAAGA